MKKIIQLEPQAQTECNCSFKEYTVFIQIFCTLEPVSMIELNKLVQLMNDNPSMKIQVNGYTDNVGNDVDNLKLSEIRAKAVADYLISKGIDSKRLTSKGFGETKPIADNSTEEGRFLNKAPSIYCYKGL